MLEGPEVEAHRHKTGHSHLDLILGGLAVFLSMVSVFIALQHGKTMERLVAANSWPNVGFGSGNEAPGHDKMIVFQLRNTGVGPARIDSFELFYKDQPMADGGALIKACCQANKAFLETDSLRNEVLPARDTIEFLGLDAARNKPEIWDALNRERFNVRTRVCYCSVFDECWVREDSWPRPRRVDQCTPSQPVQYGP